MAATASTLKRLHDLENAVFDAYKCAVDRRENALHRGDRSGAFIADGEAASYARTLNFHHARLPVSDLVPARRA